MVKKTLTGLTDRFSGIFAHLTTEKTPENQCIYHVL